MDQKTPEQASKPSKRRRIIVVLGALVVAVAAIAFWPGPNEPQYNGIKLSELIQPYGKGFHLAIEPGDALSSDTGNVIALRHIGTNALPFLLSWLHEETPAWRNALRKSAKNMPSAITRNSYVGGLVQGDDFSRGTAALWGLYALGPHAGPAVPQLTLMARDSKSPETAMRAICALSYVGTNGFAPLLALIADPQQSKDTRGRAAWMLRTNNAGAQGPLAVPALIKNLSDTNLFLACGSACALGNLAALPEMAVPALTNALLDSRPLMRRYAIGSLGKFGTRAQDAIPALLIAAQNPQRYFRDEATNALKQIAPKIFSTDGPATNADPVKPQ